MSEEKSGFEVKDRRLFDDAGELRDGETEEQAAQPVENPDQDPEPAQSPDQEDSRTSSAPPLPPDFASFIVSLSHAALFHLGQVPDPHSGETNQDMGMARHTIDTIAMLQAKTKGNLSEEEQQLIDNVLTELRLAFVHFSK
jgi:hypothetical protein